MSVRVAVGDSRDVSVVFASDADGDVDVTTYSARLDVTTGPVVATRVSTGKYATPVAASAIDELTLTFTGTFSGTERSITEYVQVAGGYYFTVPDGRAIGPIDTTFTDVEIERQRMSVEDQIEANCDTSFVARYAEFQASGGKEWVRLPETYVRDLVQVLEGGNDITSEVNLDGRYVWRGSSGRGVFAAGHRNVLVRYEHGYSAFPPEDLRRKSVEATRYGLLRERRQGLPPQAVTLGTEIGTVRMAVAGLRQPFGLPEVDAVVLKWARRVGTEL